MPQFRESLPQLTGRPFLTEGGIGTTLLFHENVDLPHFAHFPLVLNEEGRATLARFFEPYLELIRLCIRLNSKHDRRSYTSVSGCRADCCHCNAVVRFRSRDVTRTLQPPSRGRPAAGMGDGDRTSSPHEERAHEDPHRLNAG
ncbi:hypothetical protein MOX02_52090 [Methylobacterium oxalidis]|uniref:Uncharacterized protein n=1 Tax=Methylobacterium oxalidis TaxID=944322 RepID=A0A512JB91_9HYPH|nr:hypothetical protein MOX02_52090 [Methylobacterium oxalidis]GLS66038.1 hypothetical protein GCM10007888_44200 [Methylobacterium oxalidis]